MRSSQMITRLYTILAGLTALLICVLPADEPIDLLIHHQTHNQKHSQYQEQNICGAQSSERTQHVAAGIKIAGKTTTPTKPCFLRVTPAVLKNTSSQFYPSLKATIVLRT